MNKERIVQEIITLLSASLTVLSTAAKCAHEAATHSECLPDNKYDTTALEASYIAQGQANRAQEIRGALEGYRTLELLRFDDNTPIRLTALVTLESGDGAIRRIFLGPQAGGLKVSDSEGEIVIITPGSPLGRSLLGLRVGDDVHVGSDGTVASCTVLTVC